MSELFKGDSNPTNPYTDPKWLAAHPSSGGSPKGVSDTINKATGGIADVLAVAAGNSRSDEVKRVIANPGRQGTEIVHSILPNNPFNASQVDRYGNVPGNMSPGMYPVINPRQR